MGTDITVIIERQDRITGEWSMLCILYYIGRNYDLFSDIRDEAYSGYPENVDILTKRYLDEHECWGECCMSYDQWRTLLKRHGFERWDIIRKNMRDQCRVVCRFDN